MKKAIMIVMTMFMATAVLYGEAAGQAPPVPAEEQPEVLTRGPVNEAFAQPVNLEEQVGFFAPTAPPPDIEEVPPVERPSGDQFAWVPGYWAWDSDRSGYIWVSGCWRAVPPDMYWIPGYWTETSEGWQWVAGFWTPVSNEEIAYLPPPPTLAIEELPAPALSPGRIWVPPCWYWYDGQYILRAGYWLEPQPDWVWVPAHYVWTPRGYVFAAGHWDYSLERRGVLFAPVYFPRHTSIHRGYSYPLSITINIDYLQAGLFSRPRYSHYYFGDYYDSSYISIGIFPWFQFEQRRTWYDPIYTHARWRHHRDEPRWGERQRHEYDRRRSNIELRPPRTYREMERRVSRMPVSQRRNLEIAAPMKKVAARKNAPLQFERNKPEIRQQLSKHSAEVQKFAEERRQWESQGAAHGGRRTAIEGERLKSPYSEQKRRVASPERDSRDGTTSPQQQRPIKISPDNTKQKKGVKAEFRAPPVNNEGQELRPLKHMKSPPTEERGRVAEPEGDSRDGTTSPQQQRPIKISPGNTKQKKGVKAEFRTPPVNNEDQELRPPKPMKSPPAEQKGSVAEPENRRKDLKALRQKQAPAEVSPREDQQKQEDRVKVRRPPVVDKQGNVSQRKGHPSWPPEEMNTSGKRKGKGQKD